MKTLKSRLHAETVLKRMVEIVDGGTQKALADELGIRPATVSSAIAREKIPKDWHTKLCLKYSVNPQWIESGVGPKYISDTATKSHKTKSKSMSATEGGSVINSGHSLVNIDGSPENFSIGNSDTTELTEIERKVIQRNREVGNNKMLKLFLKKLDELDEMSDKF